MKAASSRRSPNRKPRQYNFGMSVKQRNIAVTLVLVVIALAVLAIHANHFLPFIADDALISLRYSQRLLAGQGLTWNPGERVEGYSNLLWVLCCAAIWGGVRQLCVLHMKFS